METIRAFIAIELPEEIKKVLARLQQRLKSKSTAPVRWTDPAGTHLTLKFLGNIDAGLVSGLVSAIAAAAQHTGPFRLEIDGLGVFPNAQRVRVVWVGLAGDLSKLDDLQKRIETAVNPLGFTTEDRAFTPHLTLGRVRDEARPDARQQLGQLVAGTIGETGFRFEINSVHLIRSRLTPQGPIYTIIGSVKL